MFTLKFSMAVAPSIWLSRDLQSSRVSTAAQQIRQAGQRRVEGGNPVVSAARASAGFLAGLLVGGAF